jgi:AmiR/NasT family two-component response regulator
LIGEADGCLTAQQMTQTLKPDILLIAAGLPEREVVMLLEGFQDKDQYRPKTIVFVNTSQQKMQATAAGADAVLLQSAPTHQLANILTHFQTTPSPLTQS